MNGTKQPGPRRNSKASTDFRITKHRRHERRDCWHYYGDGGYLDRAAKADLKAVPCRGCKRWERGDNSEHHGLAMVWRH